MYRCHFTRRGRIIQTKHLEAGSLAEGVALAHRMLAQIAVCKDADGLEIWENARLLYASSGQVPPSSATNGAMPRRPRPSKHLH
jgi:hypothetical protein